MTGTDISETFIRHAKEAEAAQPLGIDYGLASAVELPFEAASFDFATAFMSLMDISETERVLAEVYRVLKPRGFFQYSITHPALTRHTVRTFAMNRDTRTPSRSATTSRDERERARNGCSPSLRRTSKMEWRPSVLPFSCGP